MRKFKVYSKEKGKPFEVEIERFNYHDGRLVLYDSADRCSKEGYLSLDNIAAVVPEPSYTPPTQTYRSHLSFEVHLKGHEGTITIAADKVDCDSEPSLVFFWERLDTNNKLTPFPISNIYIARSEVIAVIPADGLQGNR